MESASLNLIKKELKTKDTAQLAEIIVRLSKYKKDNKELLSYLLFDANNESEYVEMLKEEMNTDFMVINQSHIYLAKKTLRKIIRNINKWCRYSGQKETALQLHIHFCKKMQSLSIPWQNYSVTENMYQAQLKKIHKFIPTLHPDLQRDYTQEIKTL